MQSHPQTLCSKSTMVVVIGLLFSIGSWTQSVSAQTLVETNGNALDAPGANNGAGLSQPPGLNSGGLNFTLPGATPNIGISGIPTFSTPTSFTNPAFSNISQGPVIGFQDPTFGTLQNIAFPGISNISAGFSSPIPGLLPNNLYTSDAFSPSGSFNTSFQVQDVGDLGLSLPSVGSFGVSSLTPLTPSSPLTPLSQGSVGGAGGNEGALFGSTIDFSTLGEIDNSVFQELTADPGNLAQTPAIHAYFEEESKINAPLFGPSDLPKFDMANPMKASSEEFSRALGLDDERNLSITTSTMVTAPPNTHMNKAFDNVIPDANLAILRPLEYGGSRQQPNDTMQNQSGVSRADTGDGKAGALSETDRVIQEVDAYLKTVQEGTQADNPNMLWDTGGGATGGDNADILSSPDSQIPGFFPRETHNNNANLTPPSFNTDPTQTIPDVGDTYEQMQIAAKWMDSLQEQRAAMGSPDDQPMTVSQSAIDALDYVRGSDQHPFGSFASNGANARDTFVRTAEKHLKNEQYHKALAQYAIAAVADPGNALIFLGQGHAHIGAGEYFSATRKLMQGVELFPGIAYFRMDLTEFLDPHTLDIRRADLEKRLSKKDDYRFRFLLGYIEFYSGLEEFGIVNLRKAAEKAPKASVIARFPDILMRGDAIRKNQNSTTSDVP